ncbi:hypothetical protein HDF26_005005 [Pedobacter cryoconitis]|nr:hypothetical protein [Pedobacter cryoconitis]
MGDAFSISRNFTLILTKKIKLDKEKESYKTKEPFIH